MLPVNRAASNVYGPTERDGFMNFTDKDGSDPNYVESQIKPMRFETEVRQRVRAPAIDSFGEPVVFTSEVTDKDFVQAR